MSFPLSFMRRIVFQAYTILCFLVAYKANCCCLFFDKLCSWTAKQLYCVFFNLHTSTSPLTHSETVTTSRNNTVIISMNRFTCTRPFYMAKISQISWLPSHPSFTRRRFGHPWCPPGVMVQHSICGDNQLGGWQKISEWARRSRISSALWRSTQLPHKLWATIDSVSVGMPVYVITHIPEQLIIRLEPPKIKRNSCPKIPTSPSLTFALKTNTLHV